MNRMLILNASPHPAGNAMTLARAIAAGAGGEYAVVDLYSRRVTPCVDCGACAGGQACPVADDMPELLERLFEADTVVIASPLHFTSPTAPLIAFFSRLQPFWRARTSLPAQRPRAVCAAFVGGGEYRDMFEPARRIVAAALRTLDVPFVGIATARNTDTLAVRDNAKALAEAAEVGSKMKA